MYRLGLAAFIFFLASLVSAQSATEIKFQHVDNPEVIAFAVVQLRNEIEASSEKELLENIRKYAFYAELDINDDGIPERIINYQNRDAGWCGTAGCPSFIFRKSVNLKKRGGGIEKSYSVAKNGDYEKICAPMMTGFDPPSWVLGKKENGYHLIDTGGGEIVHWMRQKNRSGEFCEVVDKP